MEFNDKQIKILEAAEKLFAENGFDGTSVRKIAKEAQINIAMISYYFGSKEKLLDALLVYRIADFGIELETIINTETSYLEKTDAFIALLIKRIHKNRRTHKIVSFEYSNTFRKLNFKLYESYKKENYNLVETFVKRGQDDKVFNPDVNIHMILPTIIGTYFHFYYNKQFYRHFLDIDNEKLIDDYVHNELTQHIQQTIKALLTYEK